jgi:hypothetical protein
MSTYGSLGEVKSNFIGHMVSRCYCECSEMLVGNVISLDRTAFHDPVLGDPKGCTFLFLPEHWFDDLIHCVVLGQKTKTYTLGSPKTEFGKPCDSDLSWRVTILELCSKPNLVHLIHLWSAHQCTSSFSPLPLHSNCGTACCIEATDIIHRIVLELLTLPVWLLNSWVH